MSYDHFDKQISEGTAEQTLRDQATAQHGARGTFSTFYRFVVIEAIFDPTIIDDKKVAYWEHELGVKNIKFARVLPRNAIIAKRVQEGSASSTEQPMFLFPFLPPTISMPCNPGEHIWVYFENKSIKRADLGYWLWRIVGPGFVEDANHTHMPRSLDADFNPSTREIYDGTITPTYDFKPGSVERRDGERTSIAETATISSNDEKIYEKLMTESDAGRVRHYESVPRYRKRPGDTAFEGNNNSLIVMGRDRSGPAASFSDDDIRGKLPQIPLTDTIIDGAGMIDIVVGRGQTPETAGAVVENSLGNNELGKTTNELTPDEGDPDFKSDRSRVYVTQRSRVDVMLGIDGFNSSVTISGGKFQGGPTDRGAVVDSEDGDGAGIIKSDKIRIIARSDIELLVTNYERDGEGRMSASEDTDSYAALILKANGDIVLRPSKRGYLKLGDDTADRALVCTDTPAKAIDGTVIADPIATTMGGLFAGTKIPGQGSYASKILVKG